MIRICEGEGGKTSGWNCVPRKILRARSLGECHVACGDSAGPAAGLVDFGTWKSTWLMHVAELIRSFLCTPTRKYSSVALLYIAMQRFQFECLTIDASVHPVL